MPRPPDIDEIRRRTAEWADRLPTWAVHDLRALCGEVVELRELLALADAGGRPPPQDSGHGGAS
jgi:hypothetical protein